MNENETTEKIQIVKSVLKDKNLKCMVDRQGTFQVVSVMKLGSEIRAENEKLTAEMVEIEVFGYYEGNSIYVDNDERTLKTIRLNIADKNAIEKAFLEMFKNEDISQERAKKFHVSFHEVNGKHEWVCYTGEFELVSISPEHYPLD
jgi:ferredoxin-fold anticodon binding domain-containing protein